MQYGARDTRWTHTVRNGKRTVVTGSWRTTVRTVAHRGRCQPRLQCLGLPSGTRVMPRRLSLLGAGSVERRVGVEHTGGPG